jgi:hypothetical protein
MATMQLAIIGEGSNDYGVPDGYGKWNDGAAQPLIRQAVGGQEIDFHPIHKNVAKNRLISPGINRRIPLKGVGIKLVDLVSEVKGKSIDGLIFFHDLDKSSGEKASEVECKRRFRAFTEDLQTAMEWFQAKTGIVCIPMVPARMIECWLMADRDSYIAAFGRAPQNPPLPSAPELVWGDKENPRSDYPKHVLKRILAQFGVESSTESMKELAEGCNPTTLRKTCPISYPYFLNALTLFVKSYNSKPS